MANKLVAHQTLVLCASAKASASAQTGFCLWLNLPLFSTVSCLSSLSFLSFMNKVFLCHTLPSPDKSCAGGGGGGGGGMNHFTCLCVSIHLSVTTQCVQVLSGQYHLNHSSFCNPMFSCITSIRTIITYTTQ